MDLRAQVGKREEKRSLGTRDPSEAKRRHAEALAEIEAKWANLRSGPRALSEREAHQIAVAVHDRWLSQHTENPSQQTFWRIDLGDRLFKTSQATQSFDFLYQAPATIEIDPDELRVREMERWCLQWANELAKTSGSERVIPIHQALAANGFLEFARRKKSGPLFADLSPDKFGKRGGNGTKMIGRFVRKLGLTDPRLSPSHSWRHRIKTSGRKHRLAQDILDAITGHGARSVADSYGEFPIEALHRELAKIPELKL